MRLCRKRTFTLLVLSLWISYLTCVIVGMIPRTPLLVNSNWKRVISIIFPNRWPFFTKDPKEGYIYLFEYSSKGLTLHPSLPNSSSRNCFGLVNNQRAIGMEIGMILAQIDDDLWNIHDSGDSVISVLNSNSVRTLVFSNPAKITELYGDYYIVCAEPVPYLWRNQVSQFKMPCKYVKIRIE